MSLGLPKKAKRHLFAQKCVGKAILFWEQRERNESSELLARKTSGSFMTVYNREGRGGEELTSSHVQSPGTISSSAHPEDGTVERTGKGVLV